MKKRPLSIRLIALGYLLSPFTFVAQYFYFSRVSITDAASWQSLMTPYVLSFIVVPPVIAFGIYRIHQWGWYLALSHICIITGNNTVAFFVGSRTPLWAILLFSLVTLAVLVVFVRNEVRAPYFNPRVRWWETKPRFAIILQVEINNEQKRIKGETYNISESGLFMISDSDIGISEEFSINLVRDGGNPVNCTGKIVWINPTGQKIPQGFGIAFNKLDRRCLSEIRRYIKDQNKLFKEKCLYR